MKSFISTLLFMFVATLVALPTAAQQAPSNRPPARGEGDGRPANLGPRIGAIEIGVFDRKAKAERNRVPAGGTLVLDEGDEVRIQLVALLEGGRRSPSYPRASFEILSGARRIALDKVDPKNGSCVVYGRNAQDSSRPDSTTLIQWTILDRVDAPKRLLKGTITVEVRAKGSVPPNGQAPNVATNAAGLVDALYRAVLLRPMDMPGAQGSIDLVTRGGMNGLVGVATSLARSPEAAALTGRGMTADARAEAIYRHLLFREPKDIRPLERQQAVQAITSNTLDQYLSLLLRSPIFVDSHDLGTLDGAYVGGNDSNNPNDGRRKPNRRP